MAVRIKKYINEGGYIIEQSNEIFYVLNIFPPSLHGAFFSDLDKATSLGYMADAQEFPNEDLKFSCIIIKRIEILRLIERFIKSSQYTALKVCCP